MADKRQHLGALLTHANNGEPDKKTPVHPRWRRHINTKKAYGWALVIVLACTVLAAATFSVFDSANLVMIYLLGVLYIATRLGRGPSIFASLVSVAAFDFFFVQPYLTFAVSHVQYVWTLVVMLAVALVISTLTVQLRQRAEAAHVREQRTATLYAMSRDFVRVQSLEQVVQTAVKHLSATFTSQIVFMLPTTSNRLQPWGHLSGNWHDTVDTAVLYTPNDSELDVAQWVYDHNEAAGLGTQTAPATQALYMPLRASRGVVGVLGVHPVQPHLLRASEQHTLVETFANQVALAFERTVLAEEAQQAHVQAETERMRASLLSSVSHDLRTPLATITGASSSLIEGGGALGEEVRTDLAHAINDESLRLSRLVSNLLDMTRIEAKAMRVAKEWQPLEEVVGAALGRLERVLLGHRIVIHLPPDLPLVPIDAVLIEQVFLNLLDNAVHYTSPESTITISATARAQDVIVQVADTGPGIAPDAQQHVFEKFYRASTAGTGSGLGLAICRGIVEAHGGRIWLEQPAEGGSRVCFTLPLGDQSPAPLRIEDGERVESAL